VKLKKTGADFKATEYKMHPRRKSGGKNRGRIKGRYLLAQGLHRDGPEGKNSEVTTVLRTLRVSTNSRRWKKKIHAAANKGEKSKGCGIERFFNAIPLSGV